MARYKTIDIRIWLDEKFMSLDEGTQLLFIYLLTSQHTTSIGTLSVPAHVIAAWLQKDIDTISKRLDILSQNGLIKVSSVGLVWIRNYLKYNPPANPKVASGYCKFFDEMPECKLQSEVAEAVISACKSRGPEYLEAVEAKLSRLLPSLNKSNSIETVSKPYRNQEQEQEQEQYQYINTNKHITNNEAAGASPSESSVENFDDSLENQADNLANAETQKVLDDPDAVVTPVQVIGLALMHGIKVYRTEKLTEACAKKVLTVDHIRQCIRIAKHEGKGGSYLVGIISNAVHEPRQYHTEEWKEAERKAWQDGIDENAVF